MPAPAKKVPPPVPAKKGKPKPKALEEALPFDEPKVVAGLETSKLQPAAYWVPIEVVLRWDINPRDNESVVQRVADSIKEFGFGAPLVARVEDGRLIAGDTRIQAAQLLGMTHVPVRFLNLDERKANRLALADNRLGEFARWTDAVADILREYSGSEIQTMGWAPDLSDLVGSGLGSSVGGLGGSSLDPLQSGGGTGSLATRFGVVPFSVLNAREGWWQDRKKAWLSLGIRSEEGRAKNLLRMLQPDPAKRLAGEVSGVSGTSVFDPVLCELVYRWFSAEGAQILDPFAGGSVRGVVAAKLGRRYLGVDLRAEQVEANREQGASICGESSPRWIAGDSRELEAICKREKVGGADLIFSCPPYADLEVYSEDPKDISTLTYPEFREAYRAIIAAACKQLKKDRFACFVVGEVRDRNGNYYNFVGDTVEAFRAAGLEFYNEAILVTAVGNLAMRAGRAFSTSRKMGKTHQNLLVFLKGDGKKAAASLGDCQFGELEEQPASSFGEKITAADLPA